MRQERERAEADEAEAALLSPAGWEEGKLREGFLVFIVLRSLTEATKALGVPPPDGGDDGFEGKGGGSYAEAKDFFAARTASVEVVFCGELHDVHFPLPSGAHYLPQGYSNTLLRSLERSSSAARDGDPIEIGFNPVYLTEALRVIDAPEITIEMKAPNLPMPAPKELMSSNWFTMSERSPRM